MLKVPVSSEDHIQGNEQSPLTLVEYGDYECPYCGMAYPIVKRLQKHFGDRLRFVFRNFPIISSHPHAEMAALTAEFAATQGKFWEMHDLLYENQEYLELSDLMGYAESLNLSTTELQIAIENKIFAEKIQNDLMGGCAAVSMEPLHFLSIISDLMLLLSTKIFYVA
jgi:protein-disulfide isomerase